MYFKNDEFGDKKFLFSVFAAVAVIVLFALILSVILCSGNDEFVIEKTTVTPKVVAIEFEEGELVMVPVRVGNATFYQQNRRPNKYLVTITYGDMTQTLDCQKLYEAVNNGDTVQVVLIRKFNKETDELISQKLECMCAN